MAVLVAAGIACLVAVPFNPVPSSFGRVVMLPLVPVFCAIAQCALEALERASAAIPETLPRNERLAADQPGPTL
jgi:hypothetical protein